MKLFLTIFILLFTCASFAKDISGSPKPVYKLARKGNLSSQLEKKGFYLEKKRVYLITNPDTQISIITDKKGNDVLLTKGDIK